MKTQTNASAVSPANLTRKGFLGVVGAALAVPAFAEGSLRQGHVMPTVKDVVRQSELQTVIDMENQAEALAASIRLRLECGAGMEGGKLGVSTAGSKPLEWYYRNGQIGGYESFTAAGLEIRPAGDLTHELDFQKRYPNLGLTLA